MKRKIHPFFPMRFLVGLTTQRGGFVLINTPTGTELTIGHEVPGVQFVLTKLLRQKIIFLLPTLNSLRSGTHRISDHPAILSAAVTTAPDGDVAQIICMNGKHKFVCVLVLKLQLVALIALADFPMKRTTY